MAAPDPISRCGERLWRTGTLDEAGGAELRSYAERCVAAAVEACTERRGAALVVPDRLWPDPRTLADGVRYGRPGGDADDGAVEAADLACTQEIRYVEAITGVTGRWLERDARTVVLGEEVRANADGGACGATRNLAAAFPGRVINTPVSRAGFTGLACGAALNGLRPIVEIMFPDSPSWPLTSSSTRRARSGGSTEAFPCPWWREPGSLPGSGMARGMACTPPRSSGCSPGGGSWLRRRPSTTLASSTRR